MTVARNRIEFGSARPSQSSGFTIIEVVLVIALMVALAAILWPNAVAMLEGDRLPRTGDDVRGLLVGLRQRAMEEQRTFTLTFTPGAQDFTVATDDATNTDESSQDSRGSTGSPSGLIDRNIPEFDSAELFGQHALMSRLRFESESNSTANAGNPNPTTTQPASSGNLVTIRLQPDGVCDDVTFWIVDDTGTGIRFEIRGTTGVVKVSRPLKFQSGNK